MFTVFHRVLIYRKLTRDRVVPSESETHQETCRKGLTIEYDHCLAGFVTFVTLKCGLVYDVIKATYRAVINRTPSGDRVIDRRMIGVREPERRRRACHKVFNNVV